jgi:hypothetical protein
LAGVDAVCVRSCATDDFPSPVSATDGQYCTVSPETIRQYSEVFAVANTTRLRLFADADTGDRVSLLRKNSAKEAR